MDILRINIHAGLLYLWWLIKNMLCILWFTSIHVLSSTNHSSASTPHITYLLRFWHKQGIWSTFIYKVKCHIYCRVLRNKMPQNMMHVDGSHQTNIWDSFHSNVKTLKVFMLTRNHDQTVFFKWLNKLRIWLSSSHCLLNKLELLNLS